MKDLAHDLKSYTTKDNQMRRQNGRQSVLNPTTLGEKRVLLFVGEPEQTGYVIDDIVTWRIDVKHYTMIQLLFSFICKSNTLF